MTTTKSDNMGGLFVFLAFVGLIIMIFYTYLTNPIGNPYIFLVGTMYILFYGLTHFGEMFGTWMMRKNFITLGGLVGVYHYHIEYSHGMSEYFFSTQKRYGVYLGKSDHQEKNVMQRFFLWFTNSRMFSITDHSYLFEEVPNNSSDTPEGAIIYNGTFRDGVKIVNPIESLKIKLDEAYAKLSEYATIAERAKATSEKTSQKQSKDTTESVQELGQAMQNFPIGRQMPPQGGGN